MHIPHPMDLLTVTVIAIVVALLITSLLRKPLASWSAKKFALTFVVCLAGNTLVWCLIR